MMRQSMPYFIMLLCDCLSSRQFNGVVSQATRCLQVCIFLLLLVSAVDQNVWILGCYIDQVAVANFVRL